jgi:hypothetical protein
VAFIPSDPAARACFFLHTTTAHAPPHTHDTLIELRTIACPHARTLHTGAASGQLICWNPLPVVVAPCGWSDPCSAGPVLGLQPRGHAEPG